MPDRSVHIVCFPSGDVEFQAAVDAVTGTNGEPDGPEALQARLREMYPLAVVAQADEMSQLWPERAVWYVYRDGSLLTGETDVDAPTPVPEGSSA